MAKESTFLCGQSDGGPPASGGLAAWRGAAGGLAAGGGLVGSVRDSTRQLRGGVCAFWGVQGVSARRGLQPATRPFLGRSVKVAGKSIDTNG